MTIPVIPQDISIVATPDVHVLLAQRNQQLAAILRTWDAFRLTSDLDALLGIIVQAAHESLGFGTVVLNVVDHARQTVTVRAHAGLNVEGRAALDGATYPWSAFAQLLDPHYRRGSCYFIPAGALDWSQSLGAAVYIPTHIAAHTDEHQWRAEDALFVVVEQRDGQIVGVISVDEPRDQRRPAAETFQVLDVFSAQAAIALENAQLYAQMLEAHEVTLRQLATPLIPLTDKILLLPLIGEINARRAQHMRADVLAGLATGTIHTLIVDLTGVPRFDGAAAEEFAHTIRATKLLGARVLLTGIHPHLAQVLHVQSTALGHMRTYGTLQQGVAAALNLRLM